VVDAREGAEAPRGSARGRDAPGRVVAREERPLGRPPGVRGDVRRWGGGGRGGCREGGRGGGEGRHRIRRRGRICVLGSLVGRERGEKRQPEGKAYFIFAAGWAPAKLVGPAPTRCE
jgi:hypothetical protein